MKERVTGPLVGDEFGRVGLDEFGDFGENLGTILVFSDGRTDEDKGSLCLLELLSPLRVGISESLLDGGEVGTEVIVTERRVELFTDQGSVSLGSEPTLADTSVDNGGFVTGVRSDEEDAVGVFNSGNRGTESVVRTEVDTVGRRGGTKGLVEGRVVGTETVDEVLEGDEGFGVGKGTSNTLDLVSRSSRRCETLLDGGQSCTK